jgi:hypothetical protein
MFSLRVVTWRGHSCPMPLSFPRNGNSTEVVGQVGNLRRVGNPPGTALARAAGAGCPGYPLGRAQDTILPHNPCRMFGPTRIKWHWAECLRHVGWRSVRNAV